MGSACGEQTTPVSEMRGGGGARVIESTRYAVLADRFPANNWKCKRNRPPCDSSIIESLISVWMRSLSRSRAPFARIFAPFSYSLAPFCMRGGSSFFHAFAIVNLPPPLFPLLQSLLVIYMPKRLVKMHPPMNKQMQVQVCTCCQGRCAYLCVTLG